MMNILFLDVYKKSSSRISKDTSGGYGTENSLGDGVIGKLLSAVVKRSIFWPNLSFIQLLEEFYRENYNCAYKKIFSNDSIPAGKWDAIFLCSSIVCFESEIEVAKRIMSKNNVLLFFCGTVAEHLLDRLPKKATVISGNYEFLIEFLRKHEISLRKISKRRLVRVPNECPSKLRPINWDREGIPATKHFFYSSNKRFFPIIYTRGCPYSCFEYCTYPITQGRKAFQEELETFLGKLKTYSKKYKGAHLVFRDPVFSINIKKSKILLEAIGNAKLNLTFSAELHLNNIDDEFIRLCNYAKVTWLKFGIESAFDEIRDSVKRYSVSNDVQKRIIEKIKKANIKVHGMFILAQPSDTVETCKQTIDYACDLNLNVAQFSIFTPYPGTPYYRKNLSELDFEKYEDFTQFDLVYKHISISKKAARKLLEKAYLKFLYSKFKNYLPLIK